jgi:transcriptional regulator with XRE-family HTH domain
VLQRSRLAGELQALRQAAELTQDQAARQMEWSPSKFKRIESGTSGVSTTDLKALLALYGVTDTARIAALADLARGGKQPTWRDAYRGRVKNGAYLDYLSCEMAAAVIHSFQLLIIPAMLQTEEYAQAVLREFAPATADVRTEVLMRQQQELRTRPDPP